MFLLCQQMRLLGPLFDLLIDKGRHNLMFNSLAD